MAKSAKKEQQQPITIEEEFMALFKTKRKRGEDDQKWFKRLTVLGQGVEAEEWESLSDDAQEWYNGAIDSIEKGVDIEPPKDSETEDAEDADEEDEDTDADNGDEEEAGGADEEEDEKPRRGRGRKADEDEDEDEDTDTDEDDGDAEAGEDEDEEDAEEDSGDGDDDDEEDEKPKRGKAKPAAKKKPEPKKSAKAAKAAKDKKPPEEKKKPGRKFSGGGAQALLKRLVVEDPSRTTQDLVSLITKSGLEITPLAASTIRSGMLQSLRLLKEMGKLKGVTGL